MVKIRLNLSERRNRILNIVKAKFGLNNKSEAANLIVREYEKEFLK